METDEVADSFGRCDQNGDFTESFYTRFMGASPEIGELFAETNISTQRRLLYTSVEWIATEDINDEDTQDLLLGIGRSHSRKMMDIRPELYEIWLECLCSAIAELDPNWSTDLEAAWRLKMKQGIAIIVSQYERS